MTRETMAQRGRSLQAADPLSWFNGPRAPSVFALIILGLGVLSIAYNGGGIRTLAVQAFAVFFCVSACMLGHVSTNPRRRPMTLQGAVFVLLVAAFGFLLSALDAGSREALADAWWAPGALALTLASVAPYVTTRRFIGLGVVTSLWAGVVGALAYPSGSGVWSVWGVVVVVMTPPLLVMTAGSRFASVASRQMRRALSEQRSQSPGARTDVSAATALNGRQGMRDLTGTVTALLQRLADSGRVTDSDRDEARRLAEKLRGDLAEHARFTWLDALAACRPIVVIDPAERADSMNPAQKTVLTSLITAIFDTPDSVARAVSIELRGQPNGATAVALSMDVALPDGRRTMYLAPYYLTLGTVFEDLSWDKGPLVNMRFEASSRGEVIPPTT